MTTGILFILAAAFMNSVGYLASARFIKHYNSPVRLLIVAQVCMMVLSLPFLPFFSPIGHVENMSGYWLTTSVWLEDYSPDSHIYSDWQREGESLAVDGCAHGGYCSNDIQLERERKDRSARMVFPFCDIDMLLICGHQRDKTHQYSA